MAKLLRQGLQVFYYLDDILLVVLNPQILTDHQEILVLSLLRLGWIVNWQKSQPVPTQRMLFLGAILGTCRNTPELPLEKATALVSQLEKV